MDRIVETMRDLNLQESWGEVIDVTEFMTDSTGFFNTNGLGAFTQIYDRADGRFRPVYTNESDLKLIRAMSWLLVEKVPMAQAWVNRLLDYTIGTGFDWTIKAEDKRLEKAVQLYVRETLDNSRWSSELERESYVREVADGEFLSELIYDDGQCLMVAREADELTEPAIKGELEDWIGIDFVPSWTFGVLTKQSLPERPIGYHFVRNSAGTDWDYVPAERVCLWKRNVRSRGKRGFSDFYKPHLYLLRADRVLTNTAEGAATQAAIAYIVEHRDGTQRQADNIVKRFAPTTGKVDPLTGLAQRRRRMLPGTRLDVPEGQQYKAGLLGSNNSDIYISVMEAALRLAGSVHAFPEGMLTGSYENNNFASALVAEGPFMQGRMAEQAQRKERMREMLLKIIRHGANKRRFAFAGFDTWEKIEQVLTVEVIPSRIIPMDPLKTAQALQIQKQNGWVSDKTCINELGRDIDTETANGLKVGGAEPQPGAAGQRAEQGKPGESPSDLGNVSNEDGKWLGLSRLQWQRNRKAVADVLTDFANGKTRRSVAKVLLRAIGMPEPDIETMLRDASDGQIDSLPPENMTEAEKKTLNKPFRTPDGPKKFGVYVKNAKGNVVKVNFGDPKMKIQRDKPERRRGFRARHNCENPGPKWKARYWSCRFWSKPSVTKLLKESFQTGEVPWDGRTFVRESWLLKTNPRLLEVRCPTGKGGGIDNSCKRKNKKASSGKSKIASDYRAWIDENDPQMWQASDWDGSEFGALQIWVSGGAKEINSNPNSDLSKSMKKTVDSIPNAKVETIYRVLNFKTSSEAESYIETVGNGARQAQPFASWTSIDPKSDPEGVAANVSSGDSAFKVILKLQKPSKAKDVSFLYHGSEYDRPGVELLTTQGQEMIATRLTKSGNIFNVDVVESLVESYRDLREVRCPTGKGGGIDNSCKRKNKASGTIETPSIKASEEVVANLIQYGHSPFSGILEKELLNAGATESGIDQFESLRDGHRFGGDQQAAADAKFAENVAADNDLGKTIRASIAIEEAAIEAWNGGVGQQHMDRLATEQMRHVEWMHKNGMIDTEDYPTPKSYFDEREAWQYKFEPMRFYRKGEEKAVMPTSTRSEGGQSYSVTGAAQPKFSPDRSWSYDELKSKGYRVLGGFGQAFGYQGESEITWIKVPKSMDESYRGLREEKDGDGDGFVNDGKPSERPVDTNRDGGKKSVKTADDLRKSGFNVIGADRLNEIDPVAMTGLHDGLQELKQNFPGIEKAISGVKAEKLPADVPFTVRKSGASITVLIDPDQMKSAKFAKFSKQIEKSQKSGFLASREGFLGVMHHELGHVVDLAPFEMQYSWGVSAAKTFVKQNPPTSQQLQSRYAFQDKAKQNQEVWAEAYASWKTNKEPTEWQKKFNAIMDGRGKKESVENSLVSQDENLSEAFCATGEKGGVKNDCPPKAQPRLPEKPVFVSSDERRNLENDRVVQGLIDMFNKADVAGLRAVDHPSPKVQAYAKSLRAALAVAGVQGDNPIDLFGSTEVMHTENGKYTEKRRKLHAAIYEQLLAGAQPVENPTFVLLGGGSASGKSSLVAGTVPAIPDSIVRVDADQIKSMLPEYAALSGKDSRAAAFAHNESAFMAKELASIAASRGYNTMLDGTGNGSESGLAKKVNIAKKQGMKVVAVYATTDLQTAIARNRERAKTDGRMVPQSFLEYSHQQVSALFPRFVRNGSFDEAHLYDTTGKEPKKIATLSDGEFVVHNQAAYDSFLRKAGG